MDLVNLLLHRRNSTVTVNGTVYKIDADGGCRGVADADAAKMLGNREAWRRWDGKPLQDRPAVQAVAKIGLITQDGEVVTPQPTVTPASIAETATIEWQEPAEGADWPDPVEAMPIEYLRRMADAYDVKHGTKTSKKTLIEKILVEMYPNR